MLVCSINPARWRNGDEVMREIDKCVDTVPVVESVAVTVTGAFDKPVLKVTTHHIVAYQGARFIARCLDLWSQWFSFQLHGVIKPEELVKGFQRKALVAHS